MYTIAVKALILMARNKVQFQKGMSLNAFLKHYSTEEQCFDALYKWRWPKDINVPAVGITNPVG